jgi:probable F420-dependent oxidoreductase
METGVAIFPTHDAIAPAAMARLAEERGHESLFFPEHTHIPASRESAWPGGSELPRKYAHTFDLFVAVTAAVTATSRLRIGSGICLVIERDPITTAKEVASVDFLSGGRFEFGVGAGWNREEMANHGTDPRRRMAILRERIEAMKAIWTADEASYAGEYVAFDRIWSWPKPAQRPHPPVLVGGNGPGVLDRVLAFGDAWFPNHDRGGRPGPGRGTARASGPADRAYGHGCSRRGQGAGNLRGRGVPAGRALAALGSARPGRAGPGPVRGGHRGIPRTVTAFTLLGRSAGADQGVEQVG